MLEEGFRKIFKLALIYSNTHKPQMKIPKTQKAILLILTSFLLIPIISAGNLSLFPNNIDLASTNVAYEFNFSNSTNCLPANIILNYSKIITFNNRGVGYVSINISNLSSIPISLCEYRDGILRKNHSFSDIIFNTIYAKNLNLSGDAIIKGNVNVTENVTAKYGFFSWIGSSISRITKGWFTDIDTLDIHSSDWTNVSVTESQVSDFGSYWDTGTDLDTVISTDEITELKIDFNTACGVGNHLYVNGNNLACEADDDTTYLGGNAITLVSTTFNFDGGASPGGELGGTWASPTLDHDALDDQYWDEIGDWQTACTDCVETTDIGDILDASHITDIYLFNTGDNATGTYDFNGGWGSNGLSIIGGDIYAQTGFFYNITGLDVSTLKINGSLLPQVGFTNTFDIGSSSLKWRDLYLGRKIYATDWTNVSVTESQVSDFGSYLLDTGDTASGNYDISGNVYLKATTTQTRNLELGHGRTGNGYSFIDLIGDATYSDYGSRWFRSNTGANAPTYLYHRGTGDFIIQGTDASKLKLRTNALDRLTIDTDGEVGIGCLNPTAKLDVVGNFKVRDATNSITITPTSTIEFSRSSASYIWASTAGGYLNFGVNGDAKSAANAALTLQADGDVIMLNGNVGIGTASPNQNLEIYDNDGAYLRFAGVVTAVGEDAGGIEWYQSRGGTTGTIAKIHAERGNYAYVGGELVFSTSHADDLTERMRILDSGEVGIGTSSPTGKLEILQDSDAYNKGLNIRNAADASSGWIWKDGGDFVLQSGTNTNQLVLDSAAEGRVGIGDATPSYKLDVTGTIRGTDYRSGDGTLGLTSTCETGFTIKDGLVTACSGITSYWSCSGIHFDSLYPATDSVTKSSTGIITATANGISFRANIELPEGATVTKVVIYGNAAASAETWEMRRTTLTGGSSGVMATANINTQDTTIVNAVVNNNVYSYSFSTLTLDTNDQIFGARVTYTI